MGDVIGGNAFEGMVPSAADVFDDGSTWGAMTAADRATALIAMLMTGAPAGAAAARKARPGGHRL
ncbi:hypothetical protein [Limimaricola hongkongensis]|uniref:hypothetical protein n=1 Tax=Limimaricola hongkongensis TaxID=278132 RepID=UPI001B7F9E78|nr:hypothetical protein [Limimaricola hongkongensis]